MSNSKFKCTGCGEYYTTDIRKRMPKGNFHSIDCAVAHGQKQAALARKRATIKKQKADRKETQKKKEKMLTISGSSICK